MYYIQIWDIDETHFLVVWKSFLIDFFSDQNFYDVDLEKVPENDYG